MFATVDRTETTQSRVAEITTLLRDADALIARAVDLIGRGGIEAASGLPVEQVLQLDGRRTYGDARALANAPEALRHMPRLSAAFRAGVVSWSQVRTVISLVKSVRVAERAGIDELIGDQALRLSDTYPEQLLDLVQDRVDRLRPDLHLDREDRALAHGYLSIQPSLEGRVKIDGEADAVAGATIIEALNAYAERPAHPETGISRSQQHLDALVGICQASLSGGTAQGSPRPRLYATFDVAGLTDVARDQGMKLLWGLTGRAPRLSRVARDTMLCDAEAVPVIFDGPRPIEVGDASTTFSEKTRRAIIARDKRCRMCAQAPASWCDAHHIVPGEGDTADDGVLLCRRCHRRVHRSTWKLLWSDDGALEFRRGKQKFKTWPGP